MSKKKQIFTAFLLTLVFLLFSFTPALAAEIQSAYNKLPASLKDAFEEIRSNEKLTLLVGLSDTSTDRYQYMSSRLTEPEAADFEAETILAKSSTEAETKELLRSETIKKSQNYIMQKRHIAEAIYLEANNTIAKELTESGAEIVYVSKYSPLVICKSTFSETIEMAKNDTVNIVKKSKEFDTPYMSVSTEAVGLNDLEDIPIDGDAADVNIGILEIRLPNLNHPAFVNIPQNKITSYDPGIDYSNKEDWENTQDIAHANMVAAILINSTNGTAKNFNHLYCAAGVDEATNIESIEWMLSNNVNVISNSTGADIYPSDYDEYNLYDDADAFFVKWLDHIAYNHSVHYIAANGNKDVDRLDVDVISLTAMAYNVISVGNVADQGTVSTVDDQLYFTSSYNTVYNAIYALKPDICAPGVTIDIPGTNDFDFRNRYGNIMNMESLGGTSFSAPHVAGIVATLCSRNPTLLTKQALMKSILSASVSQKTQHRYDTSNIMGVITGYRQYGSGIVNAYNAQILINEGNFINTSISASQTNATHSIVTIQANETISISLAFLKRVRFRTSTHTSSGTLSESDLPTINIYIRAASMPTHIMPLKSTETNGGTVQKLIFTATTTDEYQILVSKSGGDSTYETLYALSWLKDGPDLQ